MSKVARIALAALSVGLCAVAGVASAAVPQNFAADIHVPGATAPNVAIVPPGAAGSAPALWEAPEAILYDNGPLVTHPGGGFGGADASALQGALTMTIFGFGHQITANNRVADDFTVPAGGWDISQITFFAYQTGSTTTSTFTDVRLQIWDGPPGVGPSAVVFGDLVTNRLASSTFSNIYRVTDTTLLTNNRPIMANTVTIGTTLAPGTYWLDWFAAGSLASGPWAPPVTVLGSTGTGNAMQSLAAAPFVPIVDVGPQDLPFIIEGTPSGGPAITLAKTVGLVATVCGVDETLTVPFGTPVTYCYTVTNTGTETLSTHNLVDDQLGPLLVNFAYDLLPGASAFITVDDVVLAGTTTNNATWTADTASSTTVCSTPALAIPDNNPTGVTNAIVVAAGANLTDLEVSVDATHTWVGDLSFSVTDGTTSATIVDRPGYTGTGFGCQNDNIDAVLDDSAATPVETQCAVGPPAIAGTFIPNNPLAVFNGAPFAATWTMTASDAAGGDTGTLNEWCLIAHFASTSVAASDSVTVTLTALDPDIAVAPSSLSSFQVVDTQVDLNLDITNNGDADLDWTITEDAGRVANRVVAQVPGRQQPLLPHRRSTPPAANAVSTGDHTFSRSTTSVAGERMHPGARRSPRRDGHHHPLGDAGDRHRQLGLLQRRRPAYGQQLHPRLRSSRLRHHGRLLHHPGRDGHRAGRRHRRHPAGHRQPLHLEPDGSVHLRQLRPHRDGERAGAGPGGDHRHRTGRRQRAGGLDAGGRVLHPRGTDGGPQPVRRLEPRRPDGAELSGGGGLRHHRADRHRGDRVPQHASGDERHRYHRLRR